MEEVNKKLTGDEHQARAMLMGMSYHHGNGFPFYYKGDENDIPDVASIIDAETLKPVVEWGDKNKIARALVERFEEVRYGKGWKK